MQRFKKFSISILAAIVLFTSIGGSLLFPKPAQALIPIEILADPVGYVMYLLGELKDSVKAAMISAGTRAATYALRKVAYDSAVWVASGGKGQGPLAHTKGFGSYLRDVGDEAAGAAIEEMGKAAGLNLCKIPDVKIDLALRVGLRTKYSSTQRKPACTLSQFKENWDAGEPWSKFSSKDGYMQNFSASITADDSDFGIYLDATEKINNIVLSQTTAADKDRQEGQGFKSLKTPVSDQIKTPAQNIGEVGKTLNPQTQLNKDEQQLNAALASGDGKVFPGILSVFFSTLGSTIISNFQTKGILPIVGCVTGNCNSGSISSVDSIFNESGTGISVLGRAAAQSFFSYLTTVKIKETNSYDLVSQINTCPDSPGIFNCRAGDDLVNAVNQKMTIGDALKSGVLDKGKKLIPSSARTLAINNDVNCYQKAYCLSNIKILRQIRILPLGFEIAASLGSPDDPPTIEQVVKGFSDPTSPYYHLVDPNWVLKAPPAKCSALASGPSLITSDAPDRIQDCVDLQTCVGYADNGNCNDYAYCTREKNVWTFSADKCSQQFATCRAFADSDGKAVSYLTRTVDNSFCSQDNVGCTAYSLSQDAAGNWLDPAFEIASVSNRGIYLNNQVDSACSANSAGCSAFQVATSTGETVYLKKAPNYLGCYDSDLTTPATINWPQTESDLSRVSNNPQCNNYSKACIPEEAACNWYTPAAGGDRIPGKFNPATISGNVVTWNDQCDAKCDGYNSYREMPSNYSNGNALAYIIPKSGRICSAQDEGCSAFTNLSQTAGAEGVEYYSFLRPCITMSEATSASAKTFITYEGTKESGFQLRTYLMQFNNNDLSNGPNGSPKYIFKDPAELSYLTSECTEQRYKDGVASLDCRQFNDQNGNIYYRMISHTVPAHEKCTGYRLNDAEFYDGDASSNNQLACSGRGGFWNSTRGVCELCIQNGIYRNGGCVYQGIPANAESTAGSSRSCAASAATCRAFKGNAGNNVQTVFSENFEGALATDGWSAGVSVVPVSTHVGGHSLEYDLGTTFGKSLNLEVGKSYDLTFWAMASQGSNIDVSLVSGSTQNVGTVSVGSVWKQYHLGPIEYNGSNLSAQLAFSHSSASPLFLDNIKLVKVSSYLYLVKDSLSVDPICDSNQTDNLPGEALGCTAYKDPQNRNFYLTNFSFLCREDAIGCTALIDTYNNDSREPEAYRIWVSGAPGQVVSSTIGGDYYSCTVEAKVGHNGCYLNSTSTPEVIRGHSYAEIVAAVPNGFVSSSIYIPGDTTSTPIYLVANRAGSCAAADLGCSLAGMQTYVNNAWKYVTTTIKNEPNNYTSTLCELQSDGCEAFTSNEEVFYFKDPKSSGQKLCSYLTDVPVVVGPAIVRRDGWFKTERVGICSNSGLQCTESNYATVCGSGNKCNSLTYEPCYPNFVSQDIGFNLWSYGSNNYQNFVGTCPAEQDKCTEFVDHASANTSTGSYYLIADDKLNSGDCNGQVSQKAGCALFDKVDNLNKYWHTTSSYALSEANENNLVIPTSTLANDANTILKVVADRECGEWLECASSYSVYDEQAGKFRNVCKMIQRCDAVEGCGSIRTAYDNSVLTQAIYVNRTTTWSGMDYDGYSLFNFYPLEKIQQVNFVTSTENSDWRLVKKVPCAGVLCSANPIDSSSCGDDLNYVDNLPCGVAPQAGTCINHVCVQTADGSNSSLFANAIGKICRAYPEADSPFPSTDKVKTTAAFERANVCNELDDLGCECSYRKVNYGDVITKYWNYTGANSADESDKMLGVDTGVEPPGICLGGTDPISRASRDGIVCSVDGDCGEGGSCQLRKSVRRMLGWKGFCLEKDYNRVINGAMDNNPCMMWYPIESLAGSADVYNQHTEAAYNPPPTGGMYYCLGAKGGSSDTSHQFTLQYSTSGLGPADGMYLTGFNHFALGTGTAADYGYGMPASSGSTNTVPCDWTEGGNSCTDPNVGNTCLATCPNGQVEVGLPYGAGSCTTSSTLSGVKCANLVVDDSNGLEPVYTFGRGHVDVSTASYGFNTPGNLVGNVGSNNLSADLANIILEEVDRIEVRTTNSNGERGNVEGGPFFVYPNLPQGETRADGPQYYYSVGQNFGPQGNQGVNAVATGFFEGRKNEILFWYASGGDDCNNFDPHDPSSRGCFLSYRCGTQQTGLNGNLMGNTACPSAYTGNVNGHPDRLWNLSDLAPNGDICSMSSWRNDAWNGFRIVFDPVTHRFTGIDTAYCTNNSTGPYDVTYEVVFHMRENCKYISDTTVNFAAGLDNPNRTVAWTDRLWQLSRENHSVPFWNYNYSTSSAPYGSIGYQGGVVNNLIPISAQLAPASCQTAVGLRSGNCGQLNQNLFPFSLDPGYLGAPYSCDNSTGCDRRVSPTESVVAIPWTSPLSTGMLTLSTLFANVFRNVEYDCRGGSCQYYDANSTVYTNAVATAGINHTEDAYNTTVPGGWQNVPKSLPVPPEIRPIGECAASRGQFNSVVCREENTDGFTINEQSSGDVVAALDSLGRRINTFSINFFMFADKNQMPIRSVAVDWGDVPAEAPITGFFRNRRGATELDPITQRCLPAQTAPDFGSILDRTCDTTYFHAEHTYSCAASASNPYYHDATSGRCPAGFTEGCCIYKPRVIVKDNWGWCNGSCRANPAGCYDARWDGRADECDLGSSDAGTDYPDSVIVSPSGDVTFIPTPNNPPTIATAASANPSTVNLNSTALSVLGADDGGESNLTYTWSVTSRPPGAPDPSFSPNGSNLSKNTTATFWVAGVYQLRATVIDIRGAMVNSTVSVTVVPVLSGVSINPSTATILVGSTRQFSAATTDQFGSNFSTTGGFTWQVQEGTSGGSVNTSGLYTAPATAGTYHVIARSNDNPALFATAEVIVATSIASVDYSAAGLLDAARRTVWAPGLTYGGSSIPNRTTVCATVNASTYGNGAQEASAGIQAAIDACPVGQVVQLSAGIFTLNDNPIIIRKGITIRGAGAGQTTLQKTNGALPNQDHHGEDNSPLIIVGPGRFLFGTDDASSVNLTANGVKGSTSVTVSSASGFSAGEYVLVDANEYNAGSWQNLPFRGNTPTVTSQIWSTDRIVFKRTNPTDDIQDDPFPDSLTWFSRSGRPVAEVKQIASVSGNTITFTTPLHIDYPTSKVSQVTKYVESFVTLAGVENLRMTGASDGSLRFEQSAYSWAKNIEVDVWYGEGVAINNSFRIELRDSYLHNAAFASPGGIGYAISLANGSAEALIENNIVINANKVMVARCAGAGSVAGYNYMEDGYIVYNLEFQEVGLNASHMQGPHHVLFEGNESFNYDSDNTHGNSIYITVFRNHLNGTRRNFPGMANARAIGLNYGSWWHSFIGNVLGNPGAMSGWTYEDFGEGSDPTDPWEIGAYPIWKLGYQSGQWDQLADPKVISTVQRDGNFDYVTNLVHWHGLGRTSPPTTPVTLPNSLYQATKPAFFGSNVWPWIDPLGTTKLRVLPAKARYDAGTPNVVL